MVRPLRIYVPGAWYHVTARGNERRDIFRDRDDRQQLLGRVAEMVDRYAVRLHAWVLMNNHYHLLMEPWEDTLSRAVQWLNVGYSQWFNRRHRRVGHLFQGRFQALVVDWQHCGLELSRYVHLNPVRTGRHRLGKVERQRQAERVGEEVGPAVVRARVEALRAYPWSSYRTYVGLERKPEWLTTETTLKMVGKGGQKGYQRYVEEALLEGALESPWDRVKGQVVLGDEAYVEAIQPWLTGNEQEQPGLKQLRARPGWEEAVKVVEEMKGEKWEVFRDRYGDWGRDVALYLGRRVCGLKLRQLAERTGLGHYGSASTALRQLEMRAQRDAVQSRRLAQARRKLISK